MDIHINDIIKNDNEKNLLKVRYQYPENALYHPFDTRTNENYYINARGYTFLWENTKPFNNAFNNNLLCKAIPMGYKSLILCRRICIIQNGIIIWNNNLLDNELLPYEKSFCINSLYEVLYKQPTYDGFVSKNGNRSSADFLWSDYQSVFKFCEEYSKNNKDNYFLLSSVLEVTSWH